MQHPVNVLIIDDSAEEAALLWHALKQGGYDVFYRVVDTPEGMRAAAGLHKWDLVTSNYDIPHFSATAALALARELCPDVPFIIVSDDIDLNLAVSLMKAGADDYIRKSELVRLVPAVRRLLREASIRREKERLDGAFRTSEMRYRRLFETAKDGILILDAETSEVVDVNPFLLEMLDHCYEDIIGKKLWEMGMFLDIEESKDAFLELQEKGYIRFDDLPLQKRDGQLLNVEYVCNVYLAEGKKVIQCNIRDNTARKKAEAQIKILDSFLEKRTASLEAANRELATFNYTVSHDLRSPLMIIMGFCRRIKNAYSAKLNDRALGYFQIIEDESLRMKELIDTLLEFSFLTNYALNPVPVDLSEMVRSVASKLKLANPQRMVAFSVAENVSGSGDQKLLRIVLENLLGNAWKYTEKNVEAVIEFGCLDRGGTATYFVRDTGIGFDAAHADKLFSAFNRLENSGTFGGMGIGLATVKRIIDRHGGKVWGEGEAGKGATFLFTLP